ncbi:MAG: MFS transporter [Actinomycetota bacterium]
MAIRSTHSVRNRILAPLALRDFRLLWVALTISLLGDGLYFVALPWQVYELRNTPSALSMVGLAWTVPLVLFLLFGGVLSDRFDRRRIMIAADVLRAAAIGALGVLSVAGELRLWHVLVLVAFYGAGEALFMPAFSAIVPELVADDLLVEANSLQRVMTPLSLRFVGPALGGIVVATLGPGQAFLVDAASFVLSAVVVSRLEPRPRQRSSRSVAAVFADIGEGLTYVRRRPWLWATMIAGGLAMFVFWGPYEVLVPYLVRNQYGGSPGDYGVILAAGGVGSIAASLFMARRGLPRRHITFMYVAWALSFAAVGVYGVASDVRVAVLASFAVGFLVAAGMIVWSTLQQRLVPTALLGRVSSLDWFTVSAPVPLSFAVTAPAAAHFGAGPTLVVAGLVGCAIHLAFLAVPGLLAIEQREPEVAEAVMA